VPVLGVTGGIATGKTSFCDALRRLTQAKFFDADLAARALVNEDTEVQELIRVEFGVGIYRADGGLDRAKLRGLVFEDREKKKALEQILHPRIRSLWAAEAEKSRSAENLFVADIPLLYETGGETLCDRVVVVASSADIQLQRLIRRMQISSALARQIIESQMPLAEKISRAHHVVWNNGAHAALEAQAALLLHAWQHYE